MLIKQISIIVAVTLACLFGVNHLVAQNSAKDVTAEKVRVALDELNLKRAELSSRYGKQHPKIQEIEAQLDLLKKIIGDRAATAEAKAFEKKQQLMFEVQQLKLEKDNLLNRLGANHPQLKSIDKKIDHWELLIDKLPEQKQRDESAKLLSQAILLLQDFTATQEDQKRKQDISKEEQQLRDQIDALIKAQRAAEAKRAMELMVANEKIQAVLKNQVQDMNKQLLLSEEKAQQALKKAQQQMHLEKTLTQQRNNELAIMQRKLIDAEKKMRQAQAQMDKKEQKIADDLNAGGAVAKKLKELDERMARIEKMLKIVAEKLERDR